MQPSDEALAGIALHARMVAGDPTASTDVYRRYSSVLEAHLRGYCARKNLYWVDDDARVNAAVDALMSYFKIPERYDPNRGKTLAGYLKMAAEGDLLNIINTRKLPADTKVVRLHGDDWNKEQEDPRDQIAEADDLMAAAETLAQVLKHIDSDEERTVFGLLIAGERSNAIFAEQLDMPDPTSKEAAKQVNQIKDRLRKRLTRRQAGRMHDATTD
ncbi:MAG: RNA polymerase sigma factor [Thermomicrobiales bacterium]